jgi:hypothetical protein
VRLRKLQSDARYSEIFGGFSRAERCPPSRMSAGALRTSQRHPAFCRTSVPRLQRPLRDEKTA